MASRADLWYTDEVEYCVAPALLQIARGMSQSCSGGPTVSYNTTTRSFLVYKITNMANKKLYIGITSRSLHIRWKQHLRESRTSKLPLYRAMRKNGIKSFTIETIEVCADFKTMIEREKYWIQFYDSQVPNGYNVTAGGEGLNGMRHTEETKRKLSNKPITPEFRQKMREIANVRALDPEYIAKLSKANTGKQLAETAKEKIRQARRKQVFSPEVIERRTQKLRGLKHSEKSRANMSKAQKGRVISPDHRNKIRHTLQAITDEQAAIIKFDAYGIKQKEYAAMFKISPQAVNGIVKGRTYVYITREHLPLNLNTYKQLSLWEQEDDS